jgi:hypothetical protein
VVPTLARVLLPPYAVDTLRVDHLALPLGCGLGLSVPWSSAPFRHRLPRNFNCLVRRNVLGWTSRLLRGQGEVSMCVLLTHSTVMTRAVEGIR